MSTQVERRARDRSSSENGSGSPACSGGGYSRLDLSQVRDDDFNPNAGENNSPVGSPREKDHPRSSRCISWKYLLLIGGALLLLVNWSRSGTEDTLDFPAEAPAPVRKTGEKKGAHPVDEWETDFSMPDGEEEEEIQTPTKSEGDSGRNQAAAPSPSESGAAASGAVHSEGSVDESGAGRSEGSSVAASAVHAEGGAASDAWPAEDWSPDGSPAPPPAAPKAVAKTPEEDWSPDSAPEPSEPEGAAARESAAATREGAADWSPDSAPEPAADTTAGDDSVGAVRGKDASSVGVERGQEDQSDTVIKEESVGAVREEAEADAADAPESTETEKPAEVGTQEETPEYDAETQPATDAEAQPTTDTEEEQPSAAVDDAVDTHNEVVGEIQEETASDAGESFSEAATEGESEDAEETPRRSVTRRRRTATSEDAGENSEETPTRGKTRRRRSITSESSAERSDGGSATGTTRSGKGRRKGKGSRTANPASSTVEEAAVRGDSYAGAEDLPGAEQSEDQPTVDGGETDGSGSDELSRGVVADGTDSVDKNGAEAEVQSSADDTPPASDGTEGGQSDASVGSVRIEGSRSQRRDRQEKQETASGGETSVQGSADESQKPDRNADESQEPDRNADESQEPDKNAPRSENGDPGQSASDMGSVRSEGSGGQQNDAQKEQGADMGAVQTEKDEISESDHTAQELPEMKARVSDLGPSEQYAGAEDLPTVSETRVKKATETKDGPGEKAIEKKASDEPAPAAKAEDTVRNFAKMMGMDEEVGSIHSEKSGSSKESKDSGSQEANAKARGSFTMIKDAACCCSKSKGGMVGQLKLPSGVITDESRKPDACRSACNDNAQCKYFSHSSTSSNCVLCSACNFTSTGWGMKYTTWERLPTEEKVSLADSAGSDTAGAVAPQPTNAPVAQTVPPIITAIVPVAATEAPLGSVKAEAPAAEASSVGAVKSEGSAREPVLAGGPSAIVVPVTTVAPAMLTQAPRSTEAKVDEPVGAVKAEAPVQAEALVGAVKAETSASAESSAATGAVKVETATALPAAAGLTASSGVVAATVAPTPTSPEFVAPAAVGTVKSEAGVEKSEGVGAVKSEGVAGSPTPTPPAALVEHPPIATAAPVVAEAPQVVTTITSTPSVATPAVASTDVAAVGSVHAETLGSVQEETVAVSASQGNLRGSVVPEISKPSPESVAQTQVPAISVASPATTLAPSAPEAKGWVQAMEKVAADSVSKLEEKAEESVSSLLGNKAPRVVAVVPPPVAIQGQMYTCTSGQGEYGVTPLKQTYDNSLDECGKQCEGTAGCTGFDWSANLQNNACKVFGENRPRTKGGGPGKRHYCRREAGASNGSPSG